MAGPSAEREIAVVRAYRLFPTARTLEKDGVPIALGHRALDILVVLAGRPGEVVSHRGAAGERLARSRRGAEQSARPRERLAQGARQERVHRQRRRAGLQLVAAVRRESATDRPPQLPEYSCGAARARLVLPPALARMVGRERAVQTIGADLIADRFVTVIGPGGIGKTTVAVSVAHSMLEEFQDAVCFVDLSTVTDPSLVAATIASSMGLTVQTDYVMPALMLCLRTLRILLVLDIASTSSTRRRRSPNAFIRKRPASTFSPPAARPFAWKVSTRTGLRRWKVRHPTRT